MFNKKNLIVFLVVASLGISSMRASSPQPSAPYEDENYTTSRSLYTPSAPEQPHLIRIFVTYGNPKTDAGTMYTFDCTNPDQVQEFHALVERILNNFEKFCGQWMDDRDVLREQLLNTAYYACQQDDVFISVHHNKEHCALEIHYPTHSDTLIDLSTRDYLPKAHCKPGIIQRAHQKIKSVISKLLQ